MRAIDEVPDDIVYGIMAIGGIDEIDDKMNELLDVGAKQVAIFDLMSLKTARSSFGPLRKAVTSW